MKRITITEMQEIANSRGGKCLSKNYTNAKTKLNWECKEGHVWDAMSNHVKEGHWCPHCANVSKPTIGEMRKIAIGRGGKCISKRYVNANTKLDWRCEYGHVWSAVPPSVKRGSWCPYCSHSVKLTIGEMRQIAKARDGECLSKKYIDANTALKWKCTDGHVWDAAPNSIKFGSWCPFCAQNVKLTIEEMERLAKSRGGECLSDTYVGAKTHLRWKCGEGHEWKAVPSSVKGGAWCSKCSAKMRGMKQLLTIADMQKVAKTRGGKCLSDKYVNANTKLKWQCKEGHVWEATPGSANAGHWCNECEKKNKGLYHKLSISDMQKMANVKGGKCLSESYVNARTNIRWQCHEGHEWESKPYNIKTGNWCPICSQGINERICKKYFESMFGKKFPKTKPTWLKTLSGTLMELDGYCDKLKLAFEYHGGQHYVYRKFFHSKMSLEKRKEYDKLKNKLCELNGVTLIVVPYWINPQEMGKYIAQQCEKNGVEVPNKEVSLESFTFYYPEIIGELQEIANSRGGMLLSKNYVNSTTKLEWQCKNGHVWKSTPTNIRTGRWCSVCSHRKKLTIEEMQKIAKSRSGECLSKVYVNHYTKLRWRCKHGHVWEAVPMSVKVGSWCPMCAHKQLWITRRKNSAAKG